MKRAGITGRLGTMALAVIAAATLVAVHGTAWASATDRPANLVQNNSFESPDAGSRWITFGTGGFIDGWTVASGSVDLVGTYWVAAAGKQSIDMSGAGPGGIYQDIPTTPGATYALGFALAGNPACGSPIKHLAVGWNGRPIAVLTFDTTGHSRFDLGWVPRIFRVTAHATSARLSFLSLDNSECGPAIDDVIVQGVS